MKTLFTLLLPVLIYISFIASSHLFSSAHYLSSAALTVACFLTTSIWINILGSKKLIVQ